MISEHGMCRHWCMIPHHSGPAISGSKGGARDTPGDPNSLIFMQFSVKNVQNNPNWELAHPLGKNPGSATTGLQLEKIFFCKRENFYTLFFIADGKGKVMFSQASVCSPGVGYAL